MVEDFDSNRLLVTYLDHCWKKKKEEKKKKKKKKKKTEEVKSRVALY